MRKAMIKKTTAALLTAAMAVSLAGCGKDNNADSGKAEKVMM
jgi:predicted small lipoprotein YifL